LVKQLSHTVVENGGIVRSIQNHGVRDFPHRVKAKYPDYRTGQRYYEKGRYISVYYDANPTTVAILDQKLALNDIVLRSSQLRARSKLDLIEMQKLDKNPYVQKVLKMDREKQERAKAEDLAIASATSSSDAVVEQIIDDMRTDA
jgi:ribosomal protein S6